MPRKGTKRKAPTAPVIPRHVPEEHPDESNVTGAGYRMTGFIQTLSPLRLKTGERKTVLTINTHLYQFLPNEFGDYVTEVLYPDDYAAILSIGAGYQPYAQPEGAPKKAPLVKQAPNVRAAPFAKATAAKSPRSNAVPKARPRPAPIPPQVNPAALLADPASG